MAQIKISMQNIISNLKRYYKEKDAFLKEIVNISANDRKYHPFFEIEAELLHLIEILEQSDPNTLNSLLMSMYVWRKSYLNCQKISKSLTVHPIEIGRSLRFLEEAEKNMQHVYFSWLN